MAKMSFRDPSTHVLKAWGYITENAPGDLSREEPDAFAEDPGTVYWTGSAWAAYTPPDPPDPQAFLDVLVEELGRGAANVLMRQYPLAFQALQIQPYNWTLFSELVVDAHDAADIDDTFYNFIIAQAAVFDLPIDLPELP